MSWTWADEELKGETRICKGPGVMCLSPRAAVTNHHNLGGLEQQNCILSQFWRLYKSEIKVWAGHAPAEGSEGESIPGLFYSDGCWQFSSCGCMTQALLLSPCRTLPVCLCFHVASL